MFLSEFLSLSYVKEGVADEKEITIIPAGVKAGVDYTMVISRDNFENLLVKYRATEPMSEPILLTIGTAKPDADTDVWNVILSCDPIVNHYSKLCDAFNASKLDALAKQESEPEVVKEPDVVQEPEPKPEVTEEVKEPEVVVEPEPRVELPEEPEVSSESEPAIERLTPEEIDRLTKVSDETSEDVYLQTEEEPVVEEPAVDEVKLEIEEIGISPDDLPEGYSTPTVVSEPVRSLTEDEINENMESYKAVLNDLVSAFTSYGISNVCGSVGKTFYKFALELGTICPEVAKYISDNDGDLFEDMVTVNSICNILKQACRDKLVQGSVEEADRILTPVVNLIYEG